MDNIKQKLTLRKFSELAGVATNSVRVMLDKGALTGAREPISGYYYIVMDDKAETYITLRRSKLVKKGASL
mgnify:CR=1 FL=1